MPVGAAVEDGLAEDRQVVRGGEDAGVAGDAVHGPRVLVVHLSPHQPAVGGELVLLRRDPWLQRRGRCVHGVVHPERRGDAVPHRHVQRGAADVLDEQLEREHVEVGVDVGRPRRGGGLARQDGGDPLVVGRIRPQRGARVRRQAGGVGHQLPDGDVALAVGREVGQVGGDGAVELEPAGLDLLHRDDRGEELGQRRQVVDGVGAGRDPLVAGQFGAGLVGVAQGVAGCRLLGDHAVPGGEHHLARVERVPVDAGARGETGGRVGRDLVGVLRQQAGLPRGAGAQGPRRLVEHALQRLGRGRRAVPAGALRLDRPAGAVRDGRERKGRGEQEDHGEQHSRSGEAHHQRPP